MDFTNYTLAEIWELLEYLRSLLKQAIEDGEATLELLMHLAELDVDVDEFDPEEMLYDGMTLKELQTAIQEIHGAYQQRRQELKGFLYP